MYLSVRRPTSEENINILVTNRELECMYYAYITSSAWFRPDDLADKFYSEYIFVDNGYNRIQVNDFYLYCRFYYAL